MKLNFNYTNRKSEGEKLGQIVEKDLLKQAASASKPTARRASGATKTQHVQLDLTGKKLNDTAIFSIVNGLKAVLAHADIETPFLLQHLHLADNQITAIGLGRLGEAIRLAYFDLEDIDLSHNTVKVETYEEVQAWEGFLNSFRHCRVLRRINLANNDFSGPKAMETFARAYANCPPIDPDDLNKVGYEENIEESMTRRLSFADSAESFRPEPLSKAMILKRRQGLRSVPYIVLSDSRIDDYGALHLSYVLEKHYFPQQIDPVVMVSPLTAILEKQSQEAHCWGLAYMPNGQMSKVAKDLLSLAETARTAAVGIRGADPLDSLEDSEEFELVHPRQTTGVLSSLRNKSGTHNGQRRNSIVSDESSPPLKVNFTANDPLESLRRKIQRRTVEEIGLNQVALWSAGIKCLLACRVLLNPRPSLGLSKSTNGYDHTNGGGRSTPRKIPPAGQLALNWARLDRSNGSNTDGASNSTKRFEGCLQRYKKPNDWSKLKRTTQEQYPGMMHRDRDLKLPKPVWRQITQATFSGDGFLNQKRVDAIFDLAKDRDLLRQELERGGKTESVQVWHVLDSIGCLTYEI